MAVKGKQHKGITLEKMVSMIQGSWPYADDTTVQQAWQVLRVRPCGLQRCHYDNNGILRAALVESQTLEATVWVAKDLELAKVLAFTTEYSALWASEVAAIARAELAPETAKGRLLALLIKEV